MAVNVYVKFLPGDIILPRPIAPQPIKLGLIECTCLLLGKFNTVTYTKSPSVILMVSPDTVPLKVTHKTCDPLLKWGLYDFLQK